MDIKTIITLIVGGVLFFLVMANILIPFFGSTFEYGLGSQPCQKDTDGCISGKTNINNGYCSTPSATVIACTTCNTTAGYSSFLSSCSSLISALNGTHCNQCSSFAFKTTMQGLMMFVFFIIVVAVILALVIKYLPKFA